MKLNLGSGKTPLEGYTNLDGATGDSIYPLGYADLDEIRASHVLEHFSRIESVDVVRDWASCLKPGGILKIAVPSFDLVVDLSKTNKVIAEHFEMIIMGGQVDSLDYHKSLWNFDKLEQVLKHVGLSDIKPWVSEVSDCASYPISVNLQGQR